MVVFGEVGLAGEVRPVQRGQERLKEAAKLGFRQVLIPNLNKPKQAIEKINVIGVDRVDEALGDPERVDPTRYEGGFSVRARSCPPIRRSS